MWNARSSRLREGWTARGGANGRPAPRSTRLRADGNPSGAPSGLGKHCDPFAPGAFASGVLGRAGSHWCCSLNLSNPGSSPSSRPGTQPGPTLKVHGPNAPIPSRRSVDSGDPPAASPATRPGSRLAWGWSTPAPTQNFRSRAHDLDRDRGVGDSVGPFLHRFHPRGASSTPLAQLCLCGRRLQTGVCPGLIPLAFPGAFRSNLRAESASPLTDCQKS